MFHRRFRRQRVAASGFAALFSFLMILLTAAPGSAAPNPGPFVFPPHSAPYGVTYGQWSGVWWNWIASQKAENSPLNGARCDVAQRGPVWFLAGTLGDPVRATRTCVVAPGKAILFPVINSIYVETDPSDTDAVARKNVRDMINQVTVREASIDGRSINTDRFRFTSPFFNLRAVDGSIFGTQLEAGKKYRSITEGYWIMVAPLCPGRHTIYFHGKSSSGFETEVTYHLVVR